VYKVTVPFTIQPSRSEQAAILRLEGELVLGPALTVFNQQTRAALTPPAPPRLVLNLARVHRVDSAGLGELIMLHSLASARNVKIAIVAAPQRVLDLLAVTRVDAIFPCFPDERTALQ
jgi:anti-sigma B factor antagonist